MKNNQGNAPATTIEAQPDEARSPSKPDAYHNLLRVAALLRGVGAEAREQDRLVEGLGYRERAAVAEFRAELLDELQIISSALVGIETRLEQLTGGRGC